MNNKQKLKMIQQYRKYQQQEDMNDFCEQQRNQSSIKCKISAIRQFSSNFSYLQQKLIRLFIIRLNKIISTPAYYKITYSMDNRFILLAVAVLGISLCLLQGQNIWASNERTNLKSDYNKQPNSLHFTFRSISSILRTTLSRIQVFNDTLYVGDNVGSVSVWYYDAKKKKLEFQDISRQMAAILPPENRVIHLQASTGGVVALTADGKLTTYIVNAQSKITGSVAISLQQQISWFTLVKNNANSTNADQPVVLVALNKNKSQLCIYSLKQSIIRPNPASKIQCNQTAAGVLYDHVAYDPMNRYISTGDENKAIIFQYNVSQQKPTIKYLVQANLPKVDVKGFKSIFTNGTLLAINDLWLNSIVIDPTVPSARVISAQRTEKLIKSGQTNEITAFFDPKLKKSLTIINSKDRIQGFTVANNKLTYVNDSKLIGRSQNFMLRDQTLLFAADEEQLGAFKVGDQQEKDYLVLEDRYAIQSSNHFKPVKSMSLTNSMFVSASEGGQFNLKLWNYSASTYTLTLTDQKTISFFSILKQGIISFLSTLIVPPPEKINANISYHVAVGGADPFSLYLVPITAQNKFGAVFRSKDEHSNNITTIMLSEDKKKIITGSMDSTIKIWTLTTNHDQVEDNTTTLVTKNGPIRKGVQDKTGIYYAFAHCNTIFNKLANITIWKTDAKHGLVLLAQNVPGEAHESNLTELILTHDEKYLISLSETGQMRLWRLQNWTMVDLMASLAIGVFDATIKATASNKVLLESQKFFAQYYFDQNGFILLGRQTKSFNSVVNSSLVSGNTWFSGDADGSIRIYSYEQ